MNYSTVKQFMEKSKNKYSFETTWLIDKHCKKHCKLMGYVIGLVPDINGGMSSTYPDEVIELIAKSFLK